MTTDETPETQAEAADDSQDGEAERRQARSTAPKVIETPQDGEDDDRDDDHVIRAKTTAAPRGEADDDEPAAGTDTAAEDGDEPGAPTAGQTAPKGRDEHEDAQIAEARARAEAEAETDTDDDSADTDADEQTADSDADEQTADSDADEQTAEPEPEPIDVTEAGTEWLEGLFERMKLDVNVKEVTENDRLYFNLSGPDADRLLGVGKLAPKAIEGVETVMGSTFSEHTDGTNLYVDVDEAREKRKNQLERVGVELADKAVGLDKTVTISGLNSTERRIIHRELRSYDDVETESVGDGIFRRLQIEPK